MAKLHEKLTVGLFCGFLAVMAVLYLVLPKTTFSETEKRELAKTPVWNWEALSSGQFGSAIETYMADHMPGRDFFVGLGAYYDLLTGRQNTKDIYLAQGDRLVEAPVVWNQAQIDKNMGYINRFAATVSPQVDVMIVPSAGFMLQDSIVGLHDPYEDRDIIQAIYAQAGENVGCVDALGLFQAEEDPAALYYRTDHHWTSYGAYRACAGYLQTLGRDYPGQDHFTVESHDGFRGSTYSRSALWLTKGEPIELWHGSDLQVHIGAEISDSPFYMDRLQEADKYTVFLNGNQSLVRITNPQGTGKLLVIRDSYANCLGPFLAESYAEVVMVDLRYYKLPLSQLCQEEGFDNILILYSIGNFMTDSNFPFLK